MKRFFDPELFLRTYRDPLAMASFGVDLLPLFAIATLGWDANALVALYWLENLILGGFTILRIIGAGFAKLTNAALAIFLVPFFIVHYGMFCFGHGTFLMAFAEQPLSPSGDLLDPSGPLKWAIGSGPYMLWFLGVIAVLGLAFFVRDFILRGEFRRADPAAEMFSPYGRIVTLHVAILLGAVLTFGLGQPMLAVLLLIIIRVAFGVMFTLHHRLRRDRVVAASIPLGV